MERKALTFLAVCFLLSNTVFAEGKKLVSLDFLAGYGYAKVAGPRDYVIYPVAVDFTFPLPFRQLDSHWQLQLEPFLAYVGQPSSNAEFAAAFFLKYRFLKGSFQPYLKAGSGLIIITQKLEEQSTSFNFGSSLVAGFSWKIFGDYSLVAEGRYRHVSNAGIKEPNSGVNSRIFLLGLSRPL
ncbi:MAG TPA: acyloxyacyl hydrolase [bacterium]|nr:acyloxyacyl hydrolase [bacterium]HOL65955.1 acyloxyacyl hydrolase [bacterium]HPP11677.1 acyloxyacyl hydrolase [bacterium]